MYVFFNPTYFIVPVRRRGSGQSEFKARLSRNPWARAHMAEKLQRARELCRGHVPKPRDPVPFGYRNWDKAVGVWHNEVGDRRPKFTGTKNQVRVQQKHHRVQRDLIAAAVSGCDTMTRCVIANESDATMPDTFDPFIQVAAFVRRHYAAEDAGPSGRAAIGLPDASSKN